MVLDVQVGDHLEKGDVWATIYHREGQVDEVFGMLKGAISITDSEPTVESRISEVIW